MRKYLIGLTLGGVLAVAACNCGPDVQVMADGALVSIAMADQVNAHSDSDAKVVRLSGTVASGEARDRAVEAVAASVGTHAQIANEIVVQGRNEQLAGDLDGGIRQRFATLQATTPSLKDQNVDIRVANGVVTLTGEMRTEAERTQATDMVRGIPGARDVVNGVTIKR